DRLDIEPKEKEIYAFLLPTGGVTIKRLIKIQNYRLIIDGDNQETEIRNLDDPIDGLKQYPMILECHEDDDQPIRGRVIWVLNRLIDKPKK
ncbi:MAG: S24/S26 family peptidase, partial [Candidatus Aminicenantales bacterium]